LSCLVRDVRPSRPAGSNRHRDGVLDGQAHSNPVGVVVVTADRRVCDAICSLIDASGVARVLGSVTTAALAVDLAEASGSCTIVIDPTVADGATPRSILRELRRRAPLARIVVIAWDGGADHWQRDGLADAVVDVADRPTAVIEAIVPASTELALPRIPPPAPAVPAVPVIPATGPES
jgi:hypothetical protein